jgi:opacity protein-like surface antigen
MSARVLVAAVVLCGAAAVSAEAADQSAATGPRGKYFPDLYIPQDILWTGPYFGLHAGGVWSSATWTDPYSGGTDNPQPAGIPFGAQFGVNWQWEQWVLGAEADISWIKLDAAAQDNSGLAFDHRIQAHWLSTVTGRLGYAYHHLLFYVKGGAAFTGERNDVNTGFATIASTGTLTQVGTAFGGGVEYAFDTHWSARLQYLFIDFPSRNLTLSDHLGGFPDLPATVKWTWQDVDAAVSYRF